MGSPLVYRLVISFFRLVVRLYFRRVEVSGLHNVPSDRGGIVVAWHPNGLIDLGQAMRAIGTVPIFRADDLKDRDPEARRAANRKSLEALAHRVAAGYFSCLFPEGTSHDESHPVEVKTGAARLYYQARQILAEDETPPVILPVGLHYDHKRLFRSEAHVVFHPPLELGPELDVIPAPDQPERERELAYALTRDIEQGLHDVAHATDSWETHFLIRRTRKLVRAERAARAGVDPGRPDMRERTLGFERVWSAYHTRLLGRPADVEVLRERIGEYHEDLRALGLDDHQLDHDPRLWSPMLALLLLLQVITVFFLLPPLLLVGYVVNLPTLVFLWAVTRGMARKKKDEATLKVLLGMVAFPITWVVAGVLVWWGHTLMNALVPALPDTALFAGMVTVVAGIGGGLVALRYFEVARETSRAVRVRFTKVRRRKAIARLQVERVALFEAVMGMAEGLDLPGMVEANGRIVETPDNTG
ncbi:MAG: 1-acyl-sn-glycerol-3-phosphate acyltransferase [Deltaproteobacteria bacterium]|nr:1-acyl-sn-glycerol-3-phosphate acyltransferase [Deltaproteobacteria bacterium]